MEYNERNITAVEVYKKLEEVEKQNKEILEKLENMQESNTIFHHGFATIFEALRGLNEVKQDEETRKEINTLMNIEGVRHDMSLAREEQYHKGYCKAVEDMCKLLKALDSQEAVLKKNK